MIVSFSFWWFFWAAVILFKLLCPLYSRSLQVKGKCGYIYAILTLFGIYINTIIDYFGYFCLTGLLFPVIGIVTAIFANTPSYVIPNYPGTVCIARKTDIMLYTTVFPPVVLTSMYSAIVISIIRIIHKASRKNF